MPARCLGEKLTRLLDIKYPVIQGGMAWVADARLAAAVSNAGGLGIIASAHLSPSELREEIELARSLASHPLGVNIMLASPNALDAVRVCCEKKVEAVTTGAGHPGELVGEMKGAGIVVIPVVGSTAQARRAVAAGADAVIAEGYEAGGHVGELTTMAVTPQVVDAVDVPVVAAGGIADGRGMAAAFCLGASGVQVGTAFLAARECTVHSNYKHRVLQAKDSDTLVTGRSLGHPVRVLKNRFSREFARMEREGADSDEIMAYGMGKLVAAVRDGDVEWGSVMAGQIAGLVNTEQTAEAIVCGLMEDAACVLESLRLCQKGE